MKMFILNTIKKRKKSQHHNVYALVPKENKIPRDWDAVIFFSFLSL
jgi:hypothetical protein